MLRWFAKSKWVLIASVCLLSFQNCSNHFQTVEPSSGIVSEASRDSSKEPSLPTAPVGIGYYGDSTIWGSDAPGFPTAPLVFDQNIPEFYEVSNEGANGASIIELLEGRDWIHPVWDIEMSESKAKYIILNYALNDTGEVGNTVEKYKANYAKVIDIARAHGKFVILETPNPTFYSTRLAPWVEAMKQIAAEKGCPVIDQFAYLNNYMATHQLTVDNITYDGVHPTREGYALKGQYAAQRFLEIIAATSPQ